MTINKSTTGKFYVAVQTIGNNETIGMGKTPFEAIKDCLRELYSAYIIL